MARQIEFEAYQPQPFCEPNCPYADLSIDIGRLYGDGQVVEQCVLVKCRHEDICKAARHQLKEELKQEITEELKHE